MAKLVDELAGLLDRHSERHERLLGLEEEKRRVIVGNDLDRLEAINADQETLLREVAAIEEERARCAEEICRDLGLPPDARLQEIAAADPAAAERLLPLRERLEEVLRRLRERSHRNARLLQASLEHVRGFFHALADARTVAPVYTRGGSRSGEQVRLLDQTA